MKVKKWLLKLIPLLIIILLSSCSAQQRAARKLKKAIELDPSIITTLDTKVKIDTTVVHDTTVIVKERVDTAKVAINLDSIKEAYETHNQALLFENDRLKVDIENVKGKPTIVVQEKQIKVPIHDTVRVQIVKTVPATVVHDRIQVKGFFYWAGVGFVSVVSVALIILIILNLTGISSLFKKLFKT